MARQPFVEERVVGSQKIHNAPIFQKNAAQEIFCLLRKIATQLIVELRKQHRIGFHGIEIGDVQPLHCKACDEARGFGVRHHTPHLFFQRARFR